MIKTSFFYTLLLCPLLFPCFFAVAQTHSSPPWRSLFNGKDLQGWQTYLRPSQAAADQKAIGLNQDPHGVFKVENEMLRISGQDWGGIFTKESFSNYHLRFQVKFGEKKWAPCENAVADGGLLFHCSTPYDFGSACWMRSVEMQIQETDIGDYHNVGAGIPIMQFSKARDGEDPVEQYDPSAPFQLTNNRVYRSGNFESAPQQWTRAELVARGGDAVFIVNGFVVNRLFNIYRSDLNQQTTSGQIQFQSEGAEHYLKNIELRPIDFYPKGVPTLVVNKEQVVLRENERQTLEIVNQGGVVKLIAVELIGKELEQLDIKLPTFPLTLKKGDKLSIAMAAKAGSHVGNQVQLKLESVLGPVQDFMVAIQVK